MIVRQTLLFHFLLLQFLFSFSFFFYYYYCLNFLRRASIFFFFFFFQSSITKPAMCCCCVTAACVSPWPALGNECHLHMLVETAAISADSHVCSGLLSRVRNQLGVNKRKESAYTWALASQQITSNCSLYFFFVFFFPLSPSRSLYWFYSKVKLHHPTNRNARLQHEQQLQVFLFLIFFFLDKCVPFSVRAKPFTQGAVFLFASSNFILPFSHQSQESNKDDWLHFITAGFIFRGRFTSPAW